MHKCTQCLDDNHNHCVAFNEARELVAGKPFLGPTCWCDCPGLYRARQVLIDKHDLVVK